MKVVGLLAAVAGLAVHMCAATSAVETVTIMAKDYFAETGFSVAAGKQYEIKATGTWTDWVIDADADGFTSTIVQKPLEGRRRTPTENWFKLICCVGASEDHCTPIGTHAVFTAPETGDLFCYANDMPHWYWNNKGSQTLEFRPL